MPSPGYISRNLVQLGAPAANLGIAMEKICGGRDDRILGHAVRRLVLGGNSLNHVRARAAFEPSRGTISAAITGFAGPAEGEEVGLVHLAVASQTGITHRELHSGNTGRAAVCEEAVATALEMLIDQIGPLAGERLFKNADTLGDLFQ